MVHKLQEFFNHVTGKVVALSCSLALIFQSFLWLFNHEVPITVKWSQTDKISFGTFKNVYRLLNLKGPAFLWFQADSFLGIFSPNAQKKKSQWLCPVVFSSCIQMEYVHTLAKWIGYLPNVVTYLFLLRQDRELATVMDQDSTMLVVVQTWRREMVSSPKREQQVNAMGRVRCIRLSFQNAGCSSLQINYPQRTAAHIPESPEANVLSFPMLLHHQYQLPILGIHEKKTELFKCRVKKKSFILWHGTGIQEKSVLLPGQLLTCRMTLGNSIRFVVPHFPYL